MDDCNHLLDNGFTPDYSLLFRAVRKAADVYSVDGCDVPNWLDYYASVAGPGLLWMDHACWRVDATVWLRLDATPAGSIGEIALDTAKTDQECESIF
jgi:hypothetical protein